MMTDNTRLKFTMTNESISVVDGGKTHSVQRGAPNFAALRQAILDEDWARARGHLTVRRSVGAWGSGRFTIDCDARSAVTFDSQPVPTNFGQRVLAMVAHGESPDPLFRFHERLSLNPSWRSVGQLYNFLQNAGIPITPDGRIMAYKGVNLDYTDKHSGKFSNRPGSVHRMPRNEISDDESVPCHVGFHVGSHQYASGFGARVVVCLVDPAHVVCVPRDHSCQKIRVCEYAVVGHYGEPLPSTVAGEDPAVPETRADGADEFPALSAADLMALPLPELRRLAARDLRIVGAEAVTHRLTLVRRILEVIAGNGKE